MKCTARNLNLYSYDLIINGADSISEVDLLIQLSQDATSAAENKAVSITRKLLGVERLWF